MTEREEIQQSCRRALSGHRRETVQQSLARLASSPHAALPPDFYGKGEAIEALESQVAALLGKPAAMFSVKGVVAQQAALRSWADRSGRRTVALHPKSHIDLDESAAYERLHHLEPVRLGSDHAPFGLAELQSVAEPLGAVVVELPLRRAGYLLPEWEALAGMADWCRAHGVALHIDGARLWEAQPFYGRPLAEIAALADTVYVSFYKGLDGLGGAVLAGPADIIAQARVWQARHCGALMTAFPFVLGALDGLAHHLPKMAGYVERARRLAAVLASVPGVRIQPDPPQCNAFIVHLPHDPATLEAAHLRLARSTGTWLFHRFTPTPLPSASTAEVTIGEAADDLTDGEIADLVTRLLEPA